MTERIGTIIFPVRDIVGAKKLYGELLGVKPYVDVAYYVGFKLGEQEIGLDPHGHRQGMTGPVGYLDVDDIEKTVEQLLDAGARMQQPVKYVGGGKLVASVRDKDDNVIGLIQSPRSHDRGEPERLQLSWIASKRGSPRSARW
jgi:predicted enzyme related to lactoylglutathione lyase